MGLDRSVEFGKSRRKAFSGDCGSLLHGRTALRYGSVDLAQPLLEIGLLHRGNCFGRGATTRKLVFETANIVVQLGIERARGTFVLA